MTEEEKKVKRDEAGQQFVIILSDRETNITGLAQNIFGLIRFETEEEAEKVINADDNKSLRDKYELIPVKVSYIATIDDDPENTSEDGGFIYNWKFGQPGMPEPTKDLILEAIRIGKEAEVKSAGGKNEKSE